MFQCSLVPLNILASIGNVSSPSFLVPDDSSKITAQFRSTGLSADAILSVLQSADYSNFDPVFDIYGDAVALELDNDSFTATINLVNLFTMSIVFRINFSCVTTGSLTSVTYLTD